MTTSNSQTDLLLPFEQKAIPEHYRPYYEIKRNNFFASIQGSSDLWRYFQLLDKILLTEFQDMGTAHDPNRMFPLALYFNAHAKIRISMELAFAKCKVLRKWHNWEPRHVVGISVSGDATGNVK
jgi:hypothetical protein